LCIVHFFYFSIARDRGTDHFSCVVTIAHVLPRGH
jgi:hypothetical protein